MPVSRASILRAIGNVVNFGDTDVFPYPFETHTFHDLRDESVALLESIDQNFDKSYQACPPLFDNQLATVGYQGFRWATQQDPFWNAYLLALVIEIAPALEAARLPSEKLRVFSYRFLPGETDELFDSAFGYRRFLEVSRTAAQDCAFVVCCDISDFYPRVYHHRLENVLGQATPNTEVCRRVMRLLMSWSQGKSYGLPVGGPAARILSEALLNRVDRLLLSDAIPCCRFVDDYRLFATSREDAYAKLIYLSEKLLENEGLQLQKTKTRIMSSAEYMTVVKEELSEDAPARTSGSLADFMQLRIHYDPYSASAESDYEALRTELRRFDIPNLLAAELRKTRVHQGSAKKLIGAIRHLPDPVAEAAGLSLLERIDVLYPVLPTVMLAIQAILPKMTSKAQRSVYDKIRQLIVGDHYSLKVPVNLGYAIRCMVNDRSEETTTMLASVYKRVLVPFIRRDCILAMAKRGADYWLSDCRNRFPMLNEWERRALVVASYGLGDEGSHWRNGTKSQWSPMTQHVATWAAGRKNAGQSTIPI